MTTPEQNMATCREFNERVFNEGDVSFAEKMMRDDFIDHSPPPGGTGDKASTHRDVPADARPVSGLEGRDPGHVRCRRQGRHPHAA